MSEYDKSNSHSESDGQQEETIKRHRLGRHQHDRKHDERDAPSIDSTQHPSKVNCSRPEGYADPLLPSDSSANGFLPEVAIHTAVESVHEIWKQAWELIHHQHLPHWLRDNDFLHWGHRPHLNSFWACFRSIFRMHTETVNIWTHLLGCVSFLLVSVWFLTHLDIQLQEKVMFSAFFLGAILCLGFSCLFHTVKCHSEDVCKLFHRLDYVGISLLIIGSFIPWLYYSFYCQLLPMVIYLTLIVVLGGLSIVVSMLDFFATPKYRPLRAGLFVGLGLSGVIPALHYIVLEGFMEAVNKAALGWLVVMAILYISGAVIYALRIPERLFPGKCDIWFQSHQIFHILVVAAAFVHYYGISIASQYRLSLGECNAVRPLA